MLFSSISFPLFILLKSRYHVISMRYLMTDIFNSLLSFTNSLLIDINTFMIWNPRSTHKFFTDITLHSDLGALINKMMSKFLQAHSHTILFALMELASTFNLEAIIVHDCIQELNIGEDMLIHSQRYLFNHSLLLLDEFRIIWLLSFSFLGLRWRILFELEITNLIKFFFVLFNSILSLFCSCLINVSHFGSINFLFFKVVYFFFKNMLNLFFVLVIHLLESLIRRLVFKHVLNELTNSILHEFDLFSFISLFVINFHERLWLQRLCSRLDL